ncbi:MAG: type II toxin-antitoxin system HicB family antitoxin [Synergistaceae bacterium]|jgi:predicted RNase H-like HicB family nuclease|nr:type II toxin-antitoxin system HicB family antitoxin [Synergistaceae bacterium]
MKRKYALSLIFFPQDEGGYHVECPEISGCFTCGKTLEEATEAINNLIQDLMPDEIKTEIQEEMFRLGHCLPGKQFYEVKVVEVEATDSGEIFFTSADVAERIQAAV